MTNIDNRAMSQKFCFIIIIFRARGSLTDLLVPLVGQSLHLDPAVEQVLQGTKDKHFLPSAQTKCVLQHMSLTPATLLCNSKVSDSFCNLSGVCLWWICNCRYSLAPPRQKTNTTHGCIFDNERLGSDSSLQLPFDVWGLCRAKDAFVSLNNHYDLCYRAVPTKKEKSTGRHQFSESHF